MFPMRAQKCNWFHLLITNLTLGTPYHIREKSHSPHPYTASSGNVGTVCQS